VDRCSPAVYAHRFGHRIAHGQTPRQIENRCSERWFHLCLKAYSRLIPPQRPKIGYFNFGSLSANFSGNRGSTEGELESGNGERLSQTFATILFSFSAIHAQSAHREAPTRRRALPGSEVEALSASLS
jgi:hypothetical protein